MKKSTLFLLVLTIFIVVFIVNKYYKPQVIASLNQFEIDPYQVEANESTSAKHVTIEPIGFKLKNLNKKVC
ncbi:hypothetical protein [Xanthocytophaga flava]|uniref:hypothetical protein n=1 Tax=Xanthocytophaga flava TaxID=3048013 RepID=UPI0028D64467|nr:hypothetical protein [Xanthocytophaga flavus]MDJ1470170.1 hypothetical protein [Xanthocytophaga flavus]